MEAFVTLTCPSCGGELEIGQSIEQFACQFCGNEHMVKRGGGIVSLQAVVAGLEKVQKGTDRTAAELAIQRLKEGVLALEAAKGRCNREVPNVWHVRPTPSPDGRYLAFAAMPFHGNMWLIHDF